MDAWSRDHLASGFDVTPSTSAEEEEKSYVREELMLMYEMLETERLNRMVEWRLVKFYSKRYRDSIAIEGL